MSNPILNPAAICQIALVVNDIERVAKNYATVFGVPVPPVIESGPASQTQIAYRGKTTPGRAKLAIVGLHQHALADLVACDALADGDDAADGFVARDGGLAQRDVAGNLLEHLARQAADDLALARVVGELLEQLEVGEAQAHGLDLGQHLVRPRWVHALGAIERQLARSDKLDGELRLWHLIGLRFSHADSFLA